MYREISENSDLISSRSASYVALQGSLGIGPGEVSLDVVPRNQQLLVAKRNQNLPTVFIPAATMFYTQPSYNYRQFSPSPRALQTKQKLHTENVTVKDG
jgi:hypothetical protein